MRGVRSRRGESSTTRNGRTAVWDTKPRKSLRRPRQQASTQLCERQGIQTPSLAPRAPPSRLKPDREQNRVVVFLRERKQGAGHEHQAAGLEINLGGWPSLSRFLRRLGMFNSHDESSDVPLALLSALPSTRIQSPPCSVLHLRSAENYSTPIPPD